AQEIIELMKPEILDRSLTITLEAESVEVQADRRRLDRVMVNLLDNAIKNSPMGGTVRIKVSAEEEGEVRRLAVLTIEDQGKGLDPVALRALLDTNRLVSSPTREGTGLGLYLCRLVVGAHQGTLAAENRDNSGARFIVSIPTEVDLGDQSLTRR
ncbi:MAG: sensor histidine kinase, partial [Nitrospirales bacterium]